MTQFESIKYATVEFTKDLTIEAYQFPDGEIRYSVEGACELFGVSPQYLVTAKARRSGPWRELCAIGFTGEVVLGSIRRSDKSGASVVKTLSRSDVLKFGQFAANKLQRGKAQAIMAASFAEVFEDRSRMAFGKSELSITERMRAWEDEYDRTRLSNARSALDEMGMDDSYNAPHDPDWSIYD
jgi:hypothetical protein